MIEALEKGIKERNKFALAYLELAGDPLFKNLELSRQQDLIRQAMKIGEETALWAFDLYQTRDPRRIAQELRLQIRGDQTRDKSRFIKSDYDARGKRIIIYRDVIEKLLKVIDQPGFSEKILKILVALELFKYLEANKIGSVAQKFQFAGARFGPFEFKKEIKGLSRLAAYAFIWTLLELDLTMVNFDCLVHVLFTKQ